MKVSSSFRRRFVMIEVTSKYISGRQMYSSLDEKELFSSTEVKSQVKIPKRERERETISLLSFRVSSAADDWRAAILVFRLTSIALRFV
jgi:hypothetical protein